MDLGILSIRLDIAAVFALVRSFKRGKKNSIEPHKNHENYENQGIAVEHSPYLLGS
jgi:hypothetical protein